MCAKKHENNVATIASVFWNCAVPLNPAYLHILTVNVFGAMVPGLWNHVRLSLWSHICLSLLETLFQIVGNAVPSV
jgi:hypothetical protein